MHNIIWGSGTLVLLSSQTVNASEFKSLEDIYIYIVIALVMISILWFAAKRLLSLKRINRASVKDSYSLIDNKVDQNNKRATSALKNTESILEFLRIKSEKTSIKEEAFNLNNVLNELAGSLGAQYRGSGVELIFDIDNSVPKQLISDPLQLGNILFNLSKNMIGDDMNAELIISVSRHKSFRLSEDIVFELSNKNRVFPQDECSLLLSAQGGSMPHDEGMLGFYVAGMLTSLMGGEATIKSDTRSGTTIRISIPYEPYKPNELRKYRLPSKSLVGKRVFLVDFNESSADAIKKMLEYFRYKVDTVSAESFKSKKPNLSLYDIVVFDERFLSTHLHSYIMQLKNYSNLKVILLSSVFSVQDNSWADGIVDAIAKKPFSQERIFEVILDIYDMNDGEAAALVEAKVPQKNKMVIHRDLFEDRAGISMSSFKDFSGAKVLVVDDNRINQKILANVLGSSGMSIDIANNGQEAVEMIKRSQERKYDMVFMDINMPIMDGYEATAAIRADSKYDQIPIVALTALILDSEIEKMFHKGVNGYLSKPLKVGQLYSAFDFFLKRDSNSGIGSATADRAGTVKTIGGLNIAEGLANCNGDMISYIGILNEFVSAYGNTDKLIRKLADDKQYAQIKVLCDDMRRLSKIIGAGKMHEIADNIYKLFVFNEEHALPKYIELYRRELDELVKSIDRYLKGVNR